MPFLRYDRGEKEGAEVEKILIVEDDEKLRRTLEDFLTANQFAVLSAEDGEQALTLYYANNHLIDLVLLDGMLP